VIAAQPAGLGHAAQPWTRGPLPRVLAGAARPWKGTARGEALRCWTDAVGTRRNGHQAMRELGRRQGDREPTDSAVTVAVALHENRLVMALRAMNGRWRRCSRTPAEKPDAIRPVAPVLCRSWLSQAFRRLSGRRPRLPRPPDFGRVLRQLARLEGQAGRRRLVVRPRRVRGLRCASSQRTDMGRLHGHAGRWTSLIRQIRKRRIVTGQHVVTLSPARRSSRSACGAKELAGLVVWWLGFMAAWGLGGRLRTVGPRDHR
jgi:hypothetical protein